MKVKHVWHLSINWGRSEKMVVFFLRRAWQDILKGSKSFQHHLQGEILLSFFAGEMQRWKLFNFSLLDHVRQSWAECLFKETLRLLSFLHKIGHSTFQNSLLEFPKLLLPPLCSSYSNPLSQQQVGVQSCVQLVYSHQCRWLTGKFLDHPGYQVH